MAKDEKDKEAKKPKKKSKKKGGRGDVLLCGCGAVCNAACAQQQRPHAGPALPPAPQRHPTPPRTPPQPQKPDMLDHGVFKARGADSGDSSVKGSPGPGRPVSKGAASPGKGAKARSLLGLDLISPRGVAAVAAQAPPPAQKLAPEKSAVTSGGDDGWGALVTSGGDDGWGLPTGGGGGGGWETIQPGKRRSSIGGGSRKGDGGSGAVVRPASPEPRRATPHIIICARPAPPASSAPSGGSSASGSPAVRAVPLAVPVHARAPAASDARTRAGATPPPPAAKAVRAVPAAGPAGFAEDPVIQRHPTPQVCFLFPFHLQLCCLAQACLAHCSGIVGFITWHGGVASRRHHM